MDDNCIFFHGRKARPSKDNRLMVEGMSWRDLPEGFGPWKTVYNRFNRFSRSESYLSKMKKNTKK